MVMRLKKILKFKKQINKRWITLLDRIKSLESLMISAVTVTLVAAVNRTSPQWHVRLV